MGALIGILGQHSVEVRMYIRARSTEVALARNMFSPSTARNTQTGRMAGLSSTHTGPLGASAALWLRLSVAPTLRLALRKGPASSSVKSQAVHETIRLIWQHFGLECIERVDNRGRGAICDRVVGREVAIRVDGVPFKKHRAVPHVFAVVSEGFHHA
eukprot:4394227-Prymnesium_polylepis.2